MDVAELEKDQRTFHQPLARQCFELCPHGGYVPLAPLAPLHHCIPGLLTPQLCRYHNRPPAKPVLPIRPSSCYVPEPFYYPQSNGKHERFHSTLKGECIRPSYPETIEEANRKVQRFVQHYNHFRLHSALSDM